MKNELGQNWAPQLHLIHLIKFRIQNSVLSSRKIVKSNNLMISSVEKGDTNESYFRRSITRKFVCVSEKGAFSRVILVAVWPTEATLSLMVAIVVGQTAGKLLLAAWLASYVATLTIFVAEPQ